MEGRRRLPKYFFSKNMFLWWYANHTQSLSSFYCQKLPSWNILESKFKGVVICFRLQNCVSFCLLSYFKKNVKKLLRNCSETLSTQNHKKAEKLSVLRPDLSFYKKVCTPDRFSVRVGNRSYTM